MPYTIQGETAAIAQEPQLKDGTLWVPFRPVAEALGGSVAWDGAQAVTLTLGPYTTNLTVGSTDMVSNGQQMTLQGAPYVDAGETWVPVRTFADLGYQLNVDLQQNSVTITNPAA